MTSKSARVVLVHRYFWPDTSPYGLLLRSIAEHVADQNFQVEVFTGKPTYSQSSSKTPRHQKLSTNLNVTRCWLISEARFRSVLRFANDLLFCFRLALFLLWRRPDLVMCSTQPPVLGAATASMVSRLVRAKFVYHVQDIYPEVVCETGHVKNSFAMRLLKFIDRRTMRRADKIVVLSDDMAETIQLREPSASNKTSVIPNFNLPQFDESEVSIADEMRKTEGRFRLIFGGNVGRFQNLDEIVDACMMIDQPMEFVLLGDGKAKADLQEKANGDDRIVFIPRQPMTIAGPLMAKADMCVVSLEAKVYRYAFPSKLASYLSLGSAVLVVCEDDSQLSKLAVDNGFGLACSQDSVQAIRDKIQWAIEHPDEVTAMRANATSFFDNNFATAAVFPKWIQLITSLLDR